MKEVHYELYTLSTKLYFIKGKGNNKMLKVLHI